MKIHLYACLLILLTLGIVRSQPHNRSPSIEQNPNAAHPKSTKGRLYLKVLSRLLHEEDAQFSQSKFDETQPEFPLSVETIDQIIATHPDVSLETFDFLPASYNQWTEEFIQDSQYPSPDTRTRFGSYTALRPVLADLSKRWQEGKGSEADKCRQIVDFPRLLKELLTTDETNIHKYLSPEYDRRRLLHWAKAFIGDIIRYQITSRYCNQDPSLVDWTTIQRALKGAEGRLFDQWHSEQLETDVKLLMADAYKFPPKDTREDQDTKKILDFKYYWNVFNVEIHATWIQCPQADPLIYAGVGGQITEPRIQCVTKWADSQVGPQVIVRWTRNRRPDKTVEDLNIKLTLFLRVIMSQQMRIFNITEFIDKKFLPIKVDAMENIVNSISEKSERLDSYIRVNLSHFDALSQDLLEKVQVTTTIQRFLDERKTILNLTRLFDVSTPPKDEFQSFKQKCRELGDVPKIIKEALLAGPDPHKRLAPTFDLLKLRGWMKVIIGDLVRYQLVGKLCGKDLNQVEWDEIAQSMMVMEQKFVENWFQDEHGLKADVKNYLAGEKNVTTGTNHTLIGILGEKYFWLTFRVHIYTEDLESVEKVLCSNNGTSENSYPLLTCVKHEPQSQLSDKFTALDALLSGVKPIILIRWKIVLDVDIYKKQKIATKSNAESVTGIPTSRGEHTPLNDMFGKPKEIFGLIQSSMALTELGEQFGKEAQSTSVKLAFVGASSKLKTDAGKLVGKSQSALVTVTTKTINTASKVAKTFKKILSVVANIGKYLGPLASAICSVLSAFTEPGATDIIDEVRKGFDEMHKRFDQLGERIDVLREEIKDSIKVNTEFYTLYTSYDEHVNKKLALLRTAATKFDMLPDNHDAREGLRALCEHPSYRPQYLLTWMHDHLTGSRVISFAEAIFEWARLSRADLQRVLISIAYDASELGLFITTRCVPVLGNSSTNTNDIHLSSSYDAAIAQLQLHEVRDALVRIDEAQLYGWQDQMEKDLKEIFNNTDPSGTPASISKLVLAHLKSKYYWNVFQVMVVTVKDDGKTKSKSSFNPDYMRVYVYPTKSSTKWLVGVHWSLSEEDVAPRPEDDPQERCTSWDDSLKQFSQRVPPGVTRNGVVIVKDWNKTEWLCNKWKSCSRDANGGREVCSDFQQGQHPLCKPIAVVYKNSRSQETLPAISSSQWPETNSELASYEKRCVQGLGNYAINDNEWYLTQRHKDKTEARRTCEDQGCHYFDHEESRIDKVYYLVNTGLGY